MNDPQAQAEQDNSPRAVTEGQVVTLSACPGYDISNNVRELYGEWVVDHINPHEVGLVPRHPDRFATAEEQTVFVDFPLPAPHYLQIEDCRP